MASNKSKTVQPPYVYHIEVGGLCYIGQSEAQTDSRIAQHLRSAYYHEGNGNHETKKLYERISHYRLQDIKIEFFTAENGWGFGGQWKQIKKEFVSEWSPVGFRLINDPEQEANRLVDVDLAEIIHILRYTLEKRTLTNKEMGGKIAGFISKKNPTEEKVLIRTMSPDEALAICLWGADAAASIKQIIDQIYSDMFKSDWPTRLQQYRSDFNGPFENVSSTDYTRVQGTWMDFFKTRLLPIILTFSGKNTAIELEKRRKEILKIINKEFLLPRQIFVTELFSFYTQKQKIKAPIKAEDLDFTLLDEYIIQSLGNWLAAQWNKTKSMTVNGEQLTKKAAEFKPVRMTAIWNTKMPHKKPSGSWITNYNINPGISMLEDEMKNYSLNMFEYAFNHLEKQPQDIIASAPRFMLSSLGAETIDMSSLTSSDWLSARMGDWYKDHAPAYYNKGWWEFYRPMVALWRSVKNKNQPFQYFSSVKSQRNYLITTEEPFLKYSDIKNFVLDSTWNDIEIY